MEKGNLAHPLSSCSTVATEKNNTKICINFDKEHEHKDIAVI